MFKAHLIAIIACLAITACDSSDSSALSNLKSYRSDSAYVEQLTNCPKLFYSSSGQRVCTLSALPPLMADSSDIPTVDEVMDRVSVSHQWMGDNFRRALELLPEDIRILTRPMAAIVIDADIRPSFFWISGGIIYLDPAYLWLNAEEKATVSTKEDFRSSYAAQMSARPAWRYVDGNAYAFSSSDALIRSEDEVAKSLARLLFHELAHANDFIEIDRLQYLSPEAGFSALINSAGGQLSAAVANNSPLQSTTLLNYAAALYKGATASEYTKSLQASSAGAALASEGANATYGYSDRHEDFAMLVEETLMQKHFGIRRDAAFIEFEKTGVDSEGNDQIEPIVYWGQRGRIGDALVKPRARLAMNGLLPDIDWDNFFDTLAQPEQMDTHQTWANALTATASDGSGVRADASNGSVPSRAEDFESPHH